jgi:hypothetical protein
MYDCGGKRPCFCDAANKERFYPNEHDLEEVVGAASVDNGRNPFWGIIHVPHINDRADSFNKSLAGFLATAGGGGTPFGYGVGFEYPCEDGGWLTEHPELDRYSRSIFYRAFATVLLCCSDGHLLQTGQACWGAGRPAEGECLQPRGQGEEGGCVHESLQ